MPPRSIAHEIYVQLGTPVRFGCSGKEWALGGLGSGGGWGFFGSGAYFPARLISASTTGNGWEAQIEVTTKSALHTAVQPGRIITVGYREYINGTAGGWSTLFVLIIKNVGGVSSVKRTGETTLTISAATPEVFLQRLKLPKLPYLHRSVVESERAAWANDVVRKEILYEEGTTNYRPPLDEEGNPIIPDPPDPEGTIYSNDQEDIDAGKIPLGFAPYLTNNEPFTQDPFAGFANFVDPATVGPGMSITPTPANETHIMDNLSCSYALREIFTNHVFAGQGALQPISYVFVINIDAGADGENLVVSVEFGPGSPHDAALEAAANNGPFRYWWDNLSQMWFVLDYCALNINTVPTVFDITEEFPGMGELTFSPGSPVGQRVSRVVVQGQWSAGCAGSGLPALDWSLNSTMAAAVYPPGTGPGSQDYVLTSYQGTRAYNMAQNLYQNLTREATFSFSGFPYIAQAVAAYNKVISITSTDSMGLASLDEKKFSVDNVSISLQEGDRPGGGYYLANISGTEVHFTAI